METRVLSIGQCGPDDYRIGRLLQRETGAVLERAATAAQALQMIARNRYALVLVNRVFDADGAGGLDFIAQAHRSPEAPPLMLVSDYRDAQSQAVSQGALPGFGKSSLRDPQVLAHLREVLAPSGRENA